MHTKIYKKYKKNIRIFCIHEIQSFANIVDLQGKSFAIGGNFNNVGDRETFYETFLYITKKNTFCKNLYKKYILSIIQYTIYNIVYIVIVRVILYNNDNNNNNNNISTTTTTTTTTTITITITTATNNCPLINNSGYDNKF